MCAIGTYRLRYEDGQWRWPPDEEAMAGYALGLGALVAQRRADGSCTG